mmetsp:Transcript_85646/g.223190  ORF Transcript_85646/g.223190 Transcript_85646/m.223190 type:complete len:443 (+) Transcript_85646:91-1419(+)
MDLTGRVTFSPTKDRDPPCSKRAQTDVAQALGELKKGNGNIYLSNSDLGDAGCVLLLKGMEEIGGVKSINLACNGISDSGAARVAASIGKFPSLEVLSMAQNHIADEGAMQLAAAIEAHPALRMLGLEGNKVGDLGASALVTALSACNRRGVMCSLAANPVRRLVGPALEHVELSAETVKSMSRVGVTLGQLLPLFKELTAKGTIDPWKTTTGEAIQDIILPLTCKQGMSYVESGGHRNGPPTVHVIHAWTGLFQDLLKNIAMHASGKAEPSLDPSDDLYRFDPEFLTKSYFIDAFCCNQHSSTNRVRSFGLSDSAAFPNGDPRCQVDKLDLVAEQIRRRGGHVLVCIDSKARVLQRLACLMEIRKALMDGMPMVSSFISIQEARGTLTDNAAACSEKARIEALEEISVGPGGVEGFNREVVDFVNAQVAVKWKEKVDGKRR